MGKVLKFCPKCRKENKSPWYGYYPFMEEDSKCTVHLCDMQTIDLDKDDYFTILTISHDVNFLEAMIALKESAPIEYNLKMAQFKTQLEQRESLNKQKEAEESKPKCPICGSTSITTGARGVNFMWGLIGASKTVNRCASCGHTWKP